MTTDEVLVCLTDTMTLDLEMVVFVSVAQLQNLQQNKSVTFRSDPLIRTKNMLSGVQVQEQLQFDVEILPMKKGSSCSAVLLHCVKGKDVTVNWSYKCVNSLTHTAGQRPVVDTAVFTQPGYHSFKDDLNNVVQQAGGVWHKQTCDASSLFSLYVHLEVQEQDKTTMPNRVSPGDVMKDALEDFGHMLDSGDNADAHLVCGDASFPCHRSLLAARSTVFKTMFFSQGNFLEGQNGQVVIEEFEPNEVKQFLRFVYSGKCDFNEVDPWQVLTLADKYDVKMLNQVCCQVIKVNQMLGVCHSSKTMFVPLKHQVLETSLNNDNCLEYMERACLFRANNLLRHCISLTFQNPQMISDDDLTRMAKKYPEIAVELFKCKTAC